MRKINNKGQALVEFIIILPIFLLLLFSFIDYGRIIYTKNELTNLIPSIEKMYNNSKGENEIKILLEKNNKDNKYSVTSENKYTKIELYRYINITPISGIVIDNPYKVSVEMVIESE